MILPSFQVGKYYHILFNNDEVIVGKFMGIAEQYIEKFDTTLHYVLFDIGTEKDEGESYSLIGHFQQDDIVSAILLKSVRPVASGHEMLWEEAP